MSKLGPLALLFPILGGLASASDAPISQHKGPERQPLVITRVVADSVAGTLTIGGRGFGAGHRLRKGDLRVTLGDVPLAIVSARHDQIVSRLPAAFAGGDYRLLVQRGSSPDDRDAFDVTIGGAGIPGPAGPTGPAGPAGPPGPPGDVSMDLLNALVSQVDQLNARVTLLEQGGVCSGQTRPCGSSVGACQSGTETCANGQWGACLGGVIPVGEVCDGIDNDCDGAVDDGSACGPGAPLPQIAGCQILPPSSLWNREISGDPVDTCSNAYVASIALTDNLHLDFGSTRTDLGIPWTVVPENQAAVPVTFGVDGEDYGDESDPGPYPVPLDAPIEGASEADPNPASGDRHVIALQQGTCVLYEMRNSVREGGGWRISAGAKWDLVTGAPRPPGWTSADAAGLPILPGLLRYEEVAAGAIHHALRFTVPRAQQAYTAPASHMGVAQDVGLPPYGLRLRLKASFDISAYSADAQVVLTALKRYGMFVADQGQPWYLSGTSDPRWAGLIAEINATRRVPGSAFEAVQSGVVERGFAAPVSAPQCGATP